MCDRHLRPNFENLEHRHLLTSLYDIDSDGDLDVVNASDWQENADGYGNFERHRLPSQTLELAGDLDGDGDLDIAASDGWLENTDGAGEFSIREFIVPEDFVATESKLIDVGADGDLDIAMHDGRRAILMTNVDGLGNFEKSNDFELDNLFDVGDIDNDGHLDGVTFASYKVEVHRNDGNDVFESSIWHQDTNPADFPEAGVMFARTVDVEFVDVNSDGWLDLATTKDADGWYVLSVFYNDSTGRSPEPNIISNNCFGGCTYLFDDFDRDGDLDIVTEDFFLRILSANDGMQNYRLVSSLEKPSRTAIHDQGDINGDTEIDYWIVTNVGSPTWIDGVTDEPHVAGATIDLPQPSSRVFVVRDVAETNHIRASNVSDLNGDGKLDIILSSGNSLLVYQPETGFQTIAEVDDLYADKIEIADLDGDGDQDIVASDNDIYWFENLGENRFQPHSIAVGFQHWSLGDFNNDGLDDIIMASRDRRIADRSRSVIGINQGGSFSLSLVWIANRRIQNFYAVDLDQDQDMDVFANIGYYDDNGRDWIDEFIWFENVDNGNLSVPKVLTQEESSRDPRNVVDLNGDGRSDLLITTQNHELRWINGIASDGEMAESALLFKRDDYVQIFPGDFDNDGDIDIVFSDKQNHWIENLDGAANFSEPRVLSHGLGSMLHFGDYDSDGDTDMIGVSQTGEIKFLETMVAGDSNNDGIFNSNDLVNVLQSAQFEDRIYRNSTFETGDWNGDREFDSRDLVFVFQAGNYSAAAHRDQTIAVWIFPSDDDLDENIALEDIAASDGWLENTDGAGEFSVREFI